MNGCFYEDLGMGECEGEVSEEGYCKRHGEDQAVRAAWESRHARRRPWTAKDTVDQDG